MKLRMKKRNMDSCRITKKGKGRRMRGGIGRKGNNGNRQHGWYVLSYFLFSAIKQRALRPSKIATSPESSAHT